MGNLSHYTGSNFKNGHDSPGDNLDHGADAADGYASEDFVPGSSSSASSRERKKGLNFIIFSRSILFFDMIYELITCLVLSILHTTVGTRVRFTLYFIVQISNMFWKVLILLEIFLIASSEM